MDLEVDKICQDLMNNIANALNQYFYLTMYLYYDSYAASKEESEHLWNWGLTGHLISTDYKNAKVPLTKYSDLIAPINWGIHLIDKLSFKADCKIPEAYKTVEAEEKDKYSGFNNSEGKKGVYKFFKDNGASLKSLVTTIHDQYFELIIARVKTIRENKK